MITGENIVIAVGGRPRYPKDVRMDGNFVSLVLPFKSDAAVVVHLSFMR